jgi:hypothetical protein
MALPDPVSAAVAQVEEFCKRRVPEEHRDAIRVEHRVRGNAITIFECRPPWSGDADAEWTRTTVAQLRHQASSSVWSLHWQDSRGRWHLYDDGAKARDVRPLLAEVTADPDGVFWG